jgi:hypothetical protein
MAWNLQAKALHFKEDPLKLIYKKLKMGLRAATLGRSGTAGKQL